MSFRLVAAPSATGPSVPLLRAGGEDGCPDAAGCPPGSHRRGAGVRGQEEADQRLALAHQ